MRIMRYKFHQTYCKKWPEWGRGNAPKLRMPRVSRGSQLRPSNLLSYANHERQKPT